MLFYSQRYLLTRGKEGPDVVDTMATLGRSRTHHLLRHAFSPGAPPSQAAQETKQKLEHATKQPINRTFSMS